MARESTTCTSAHEYLNLVKSLVDSVDASTIDQFTNIIFDAWKNHRQVFVFGNGGSAAAASHYVTDFIKTSSVAGQHLLRTYSLTDNIPMLTAIGNDIGYDQIFEYPLSAYAKPHDVAVAISGSGTSKNVVNACEWARANGLVVVSLTGFDGGKIGRLADLHINIPASNYGVVEDFHMLICHIVIQSLQTLIRKEVA